VVKLESEVEEVEETPVLELLEEEIIPPDGSVVGVPVATVLLFVNGS